MGDKHETAQEVGAVKLALSGLLSLALGVGVARFVYTPILPFMMEGVPLDAAQGGLIASSNFVGYLVGALVASVPGLPGPRHLWLLAGLLGCAVTTAAVGASDKLAFLIGIRFASGVACAFVFVFAIATVLDGLARAGRPRLAALLFMGVGAGIVASSLLVSTLAAAGAGWRSLWLGNGVISAAGIAAIAALGGLRARPRSAPAEAVLTISPGRGNAVMGAFALSYGLFGFGYVITTTFIVALVRATPSLAASEPLIWPIVGVTSMGAVVFWNLVAQRVGRAPAYIATGLVEAVGVALSVLWPTTAGIVTAAVLLGATFVPATALGLNLAKELSSQDSRRVVATMTVAWSLGQIVGPILAGYLHAATGSYFVPSLAGAAALLLSAALALPTLTAGRPR